MVTDFLVKANFVDKRYPRADDVFKAEMLLKLCKRTDK